MKRSIWFNLVIALLIVGCATRQSRWEAAKSANTIEAYEEFLVRYPVGEFAQKAQESLEELEFQKALTEDTAKAYLKFLSKHSLGDLADRARKRLAYRYARDKDTIHAYRKFLRMYPQGEPADKARSRLTALLEVHGSAKIIKVNVEQSGDISLPFENLSQELWEYAGVNVVKGGINYYDFYLEIRAKGEAIAAEYTFGPIPFRGSGESFYTGALLSGIILLKDPDNNVVYRRQFKDKTAPPYKMEISRTRLWHPE